MNWKSKYRVRKTINFRSTTPPSKTLLLTNAFLEYEPIFDDCCEMPLLADKGILRKFSEIYFHFFHQICTNGTFA